MSSAVASPSPNDRLSPTVRTWWTILRICLEERLVYRGDFMLGTLMRFLPIVTQIFLWTAVYSAVTQSSIAGYSRDEIIAYFLLTMVARAFSSMPGLASGISRSIRDGSIKKFITQPVDMIGFLLLGRVAHKLVYYTVATLPFALVFFLCRGFFTHGWPDATTVLIYLWSLVMAFLLGFLLETTIGMLGFWFLEVSSLLFVYMLFNFFLSGHMFPIDLLDGIQLAGTFTLGDAVRMLPLQYLAYFPTAVFLGKITGPELIRGLIVQFGWVVFFCAAARWSFHRGLRRYSAFGG
ncbi:MAG: ABC-2 family transporter protein [Pirellulales bacterium]|nr:ABC-2 family transporter protein [Pirellulales bacterium]